MGSLAFLEPQEKRVNLENQVLRDLRGKEEDLVHPEMVMERVHL